MSTITLDVIGRDRGATRLMKELGKETDVAHRRYAAFGKAAAVAGLAVAAAAIKFGTSSVRAYTEAQTAQAKLQNAFQKFPALADTNINSLRALNTELAKKTRFDDDATASGQAVLAQFKLTGQQITQLTPLLQDYAAKTGKDLPTAATDLGKAMLGQGRALKAVGINFKATGDTGADFEQLMGSLRTQVGGFATAEGKTAAGQIAILRNQFGELQEAVGAKLVPSLSKAVTGLITLVGWIDENKQVVGPLSASIAGIAGSIGLVVVSAKGIRAVSTAFDVLSISAKGAGLAVAGVGLAVGIATFAWANYAKKQAEAKQETESLTDALVLSNGAIDESIRAGKAKALQQSGAADQAKNLGVSLELLTRAHLGEAGAIAEVNAILNSHISRQAEASAMGARMSTTQAEQSRAARKLKDDLAAGNITLAEARQRAKELGSATKGAGGAQDTMADKTKRAREELNRWRTSMFSAARAALGLAGSEDEVEAAIDEATRAVRTNGRTLDINTEKGRSNRAALRNLASASLAYREKLVEQGASQQRVTRATDNARSAFIKTAEKMGLSSREAKRLADRFGLVDRKINDLNSKTVKTKVTFSVSGSGFTLHIPNSLSVVKNMGGGKPGPSRLDLGPGAASGAPLTVTHSHGHGKESGGPGIVHPQIARNMFPDPGYTGRELQRRGALAIARTVGTMIGKSNLGLGAMTSPGGSYPAYSANQAATIARLRAAGARSFTTYPGHHPSMARARDVTPHNWRLANIARASSGVWYVIYQMRIASKNHGNTWRPYHPRNFRGDWQHRRHIHVAWYDRGGLLRSGGVAVNTSGKPERVLSPAMTKSFDRLLVKALGRDGGARPVNLYIDLGDGVRQVIRGELDEHDEYKASISRMHR